MKALIVHGKALAYEEVADPRIEDSRDVVVRMTKASICGSDLHLLSDRWTPPREVYGIGHEAIGEVIEIGKNVTNVQLGDHIILSGIVSCGECRPCLSGELKRCQNGATNVYGVGQGLEGCQAEAIRVPAADFNSMRIPDGVSDDQAVLLTDGLVTAYAACLGAEIRPGRSVAVIGLGPIGLMAVELAIVMGASVVYAVDPVKDRRTRAASLGAIPVPPEELVETVREATNGLMVDCVLEAVGKTGTVDLAMATVGVGRNVSILGAGMDLEVKVPFEAILNGVTVRANMLTEISRFWPELVPLLQSGRIHPEKVITDRVTLEQGPEAYRRVAAREDGVSKVVLTA